LEYPGGDSANRVSRLPVGARDRAGDPRPGPLGTGVMCRSWNPLTIGVCARPTGAPNSCVVNHRRLDVVVPQEFLHRPDVATAFGR
jgi:hypothetical protein